MKADIAIMTIRDDEYGAVFDRLEEYDLKPFRGSASKRTYAIFSVPTITKKTCVVALARSPEQGNDVSQLVASDIMRDLDPQLLLVVGIAGGIPHNEFTLGDVVISARIHNFSVNAIKQDDITFNVMGGIHPFVSDIVASLPMYRRAMAGWNENDSIGMARPLVDLSWVESNRYGDAKWREDVFTSLETHFGASASGRLPLFKTGGIASSNSLMKDTKIPTKWLEAARSILAIEMESAGALQAAQQMDKQYPVMAIRGISDIIGLKRDERWTPYACQTAGAFTCAFIKADIIEPLVDETKTTNPASQPSHLSPTPQEKMGNSTLTNGTPNSQGVAPLDVFISYAVEDERFKIELEKHLVMLRRTGVIRTLHSQQIGTAGLEWNKDISDIIDQSQIILLMISPSFLASDYLYDQEMKRAMARHASDDARVIPIILRSVDISDTPFSVLVSLPRNNLPVDVGRNRDEVWKNIAIEIRAICDNLRNSQRNP
jgi:nucleoside phosphorylase